MSKQLSYYFPWEELNDKQIYSKVREFCDNGCRRFVISDGLIKKLIVDDEKVKFLRQLCKDMEVEFPSIHALCGNTFDLSWSDPDRRAGLVADHIKAMEIAASFGCRTYVLHVGAAEYCYDHKPMDKLRDLAIDSLEKLLPAAEKLNMILAVENSQEPTNTAAEVMKIINVFNNHPNIGACFDTGHANLLASAPGKTIDRYEPYFEKCWWDGGLKQEDNAIELMKDQIVTCHIHDNNGYGDLHGMPFDGTINWPEMMQKLFSCPRMIDYQTEVIFNWGKNWAGNQLAPQGGYSVRRLADTFRYLGF